MLLNGTNAMVHRQTLTLPNEPRMYRFLPVNGYFIESWDKGVSGWVVLHVVLKTRRKKPWMIVNDWSEKGVKKLRLDYLFAFQWCLPNGMSFLPDITKEKINIFPKIGWYPVPFLLRRIGNCDFIEFLVLSHGWIWAWGLEGVIVFIPVLHYSSAVLSCQCGLRLLNNSLEVDKGTALFNGTLSAGLNETRVGWCLLERQSAPSVLL